MPLAEVNGTSLFHRSCGSGQDVVLAHGLGASHAFWYPKIVPELARNHRVTVYDLRGHGRSAMPDSGYRLPVLADDLVGLLDSLGIRRAHLIGHSFGGAIALELALRLPERVASVVVADSRLLAGGRERATRNWDGFEGWQAELAKSGVQVDHRTPLDHHMLARLARQSVRRPGRSPAGTPFAGFGAGGRSGQRWLELLARTSAASELDSGSSIAAARLRGLEPPALAIYGARSFALPSGRRLARTAPRCQLLVIPRAGHFNPVAAPTPFLAGVRRFLSTGSAWNRAARV